ncbi:hypothetical protein JOQ06_008766, partial [Pogonophryne albipinna]
HPTNTSRECCGDFPACKRQHTRDFYPETKWGDNPYTNTRTCSDQVWPCQ